MDIFEELAMRHLCRDGFEFLNPQFEIADGWACPDFVSLNVIKKIVRVIEVSVAYDVGNLVAKVNDCEGRWFRHLRTHFASGTVASSSLPMSRQTISALYGPIGFSWPVTSKSMSSVSPST